MGAVNAFRKLDDVDKPQIIIGAGASIETLAIGKLANDNEIVLLTPVSSAAEISNLGHSFSELSIRCTSSEHAGQVGYSCLGTARFRSYS